MNLNSPDEKLHKIVEYACKSGATGARAISTADIVVDSSLAAMCRNPKCENYGLSPSCPPHVSGPIELKRQLENFNHAIFFKIDVPSEILFSSERRELFQMLHETAAGIERTAIGMGFSNARAYAGGSCKKIFCHEHRACLALSANGKCRNPQHARPSMSGFGIDVSKLFDISGWTMRWLDQQPDASTTQMANVCGLVLIC